MDPVGWWIASLSNDFKVETVYAYKSTLYPFSSGVWWEGNGLILTKENENGKWMETPSDWIKSSTLTVKVEDKVRSIDTFP